MSESLFQISCPSCESVFAVTDPELVGQIIACPKCGGMMLVEAAEVAQNVEIAQDGKGASLGETGRIAANGGDFADASKSPIAEESRVEKEGGDESARLDGGENSEDGGNSENGEDGEDGKASVEENGAASERSRSGGKFVASGIALLIVGALAFFGLRVFNGESTPLDATNAEVDVDENSENRGDGEGASTESQEEVGGFAPAAREERTSGVDASVRQSESSAFGFGGIEESAGVGEVDPNEENGENAEAGEDALGFAAATDAGEETTLDAEGAQTGEVGEINEVGESGEVGGVEESASSESVDDGGNPLPEDDNLRDGGDLSDSGALDGGDGLDGLDDLDDLEGMGEDVALNEEENETPALEDDEAAGRDKLAGSNAATGFNEADFERANQNADPENADEPSEVDWSGVASTTSPTLQGALPTLRRERKEIDIDARLALPIKSIEFPTSPVAAVRLLSEFAGVSIVPDLETFALTRSSANATLDLTLRDVTVGEALDEVAALLNWEVCKEKERILLRPAGRSSEEFVEERFDVADLTAARAAGKDETRLEMFELPNNLTPEALAELIKSTVAPETWGENGGRATLKIDGSTLIIGQNAQNREKTRILLEGLRATRGLEPQENAAPERIIPEKLGWERLTKKMTFAPLSPLSLQNAVEILEKSQKFQVFWDDAALIEAGVGRDATTAAKVENGTLDLILSEILEPLKATYLILDEKLILITTKDAAESYQTVEFFSLVGKNGVRPTLSEARGLVEELKQTIAPESWSKNNASTAELATTGEDAGNSGFAETLATAESVPPGESVLAAENASIAGNSDVEENKGNEEVARVAAIDENGENSKNGEDGENASLSEEKSAIWLDVESSCLIIRQSQPVQRAIRRWLTAHLAESAGAKEGNPN